MDEMVRNDFAGMADDNLMEGISRWADLIQTQARREGEASMLYEAYDSRDIWEFILGKKAELEEETK